MRILPWGFLDRPIQLFYFLVGKQKAVLCLQTSQSGGLAGQEYEDGSLQTQASLQFSSERRAVPMCQGGFEITVPESGRESDGPSRWKWCPGWPTNGRVASGGHGGVPTLGLESCSKAAGVLLGPGGVRLNGSRVPHMGNLHSRALHMGAWKAHLRLPLEPLNRAGSICCLWGEVPRVLS